MKFKRASVRGWVIFFIILALLLGGLFWWLSRLLDVGAIVG